jgi:hypothetical protein
MATDPAARGIGVGRILQKLFSPWGKVMLASVLAGTSLLVAVPQATRAQTPTVKLNILGFGAVPWNIGNIVPGSSGTQSLSLRNVGSRPGNVTVWLSNVQTQKSAAVSPKFAGAPQIDYYLTLGLSGRGISTYVAPISIRSFPHTADAPNKISLGILGPGQEMELDWHWALPALAGNGVQGDAVTFDINYMIEELGPETLPPRQSAAPYQPPPPELAGPVGSVQIILPGRKVIAKVGGDTDATQAPVTATSATARIRLSLDANTKIANADPGVDAVPHTIEATVMTPEEVAEAGIRVPDGWVLVSDVWEISGYTYGVPHRITVDPPAKLAIGYDPALLPADVEAVGLFYYDESTGRWEELQVPEGYVAEEGMVGGETGHFSIFAVLARGTAGVAPPDETPIVKPPTTPVPAARFSVRGLSVDPSRIEVGQSAIVAVKVANMGGQAGDYTVTLTLDGKAFSQTVSLAPGQVKEIDFPVSPGLPGTYRVDVNGLEGELNVISVPLVLDYRQPVYWWLVLLATAVAVLMLMTVKVGSTVPDQATVAAGRQRVTRRTQAALMRDRGITEMFIVPARPSISARTSISLRAYVRRADGTEMDVTGNVEWRSDEPRVAEVLDDSGFKGVVFGLGPGSATVTARLDGRAISTVVGVGDVPTPATAATQAAAPGPADEAIESIAVTPAETVMVVGETARFKATAMRAGGSAEDVTKKATWSSKNDFVADTQEGGQVTAFSTGVTAVLATYRGHRGSATVRVQPPPPDDSGE